MNKYFFQLERAYEQFIEPLEDFRRNHIGAVKERKKKFEKQASFFGSLCVKFNCFNDFFLKLLQTAKFCASQERYLGLSTKKQDTVLQEVGHYIVLRSYYFLRRRPLNWDALLRGLKIF